MGGRNKYNHEKIDEKMNVNTKYNHEKLFLKEVSAIDRYEIFHLVGAGRYT